jgi:hypothetical protein
MAPRRSSALLLVLASCAAAAAPPAPYGGPAWTVLRPGDFTRDGDALVSAAITARPFDEAVLSWNAAVPEGTLAEFQLRVQVATEWSRWRTMGVARGAALSSVPQEPDEFTRVEIDTLVVKPDAQAFQVRVKPAGVKLASVGVTHYRAKAPRTCGRTPSPAWGRVLEVPPRSQTVERREIAGEICSPTSVAMALEWLGVTLATEEVARRVYDGAAKIYGNWPCNTAAAGACIGEAFVVRAEGWEEVEAEIAGGRPVVISHKWKRGELTGAPIESSAGHLILVVGFTAEGDVVVNDPAAKPDGVRRTYKRAELFHTWQGNASGIAYLFRPRVP